MTWDDIQNQMEHDVQVFSLQCQPILKFAESIGGPEKVLDNERRFRGHVDNAIKMLVEQSYFPSLMHRDAKFWCGCRLNAARFFVRFLASGQGTAGTQVFRTPVYQWLLLDSWYQYGLPLTVLPIGPENDIRISNPFLHVTAEEPSA